MTKKQGLRLTAFFLLAALLIFGLGQLLRDRDTTLSSLYSEPDDTVDVFIVGSSHVNSGFMPAVLWKEYGISAHNVFSWSQPMWISYYFIEEALRTQSPQVIVLDLYGMMYGNSTEQPKAIDEVNYKNSFQIDTDLTFLRMIQTVKTCGIDLRNPIDFLNIVRYHTRWKYLDRTAWTYDPHRDPDYLKGYGPQFDVFPCDVPASSGSIQAREPYDTAVLWLDKIVGLCKEHGIELVFTMTPYTYQASELEIFRWLEQYATERDIPFLNYADGDGARIGFDYTSQMSDSGHLNYHGAFLITRDLGAFLQDNFPLPAPESHPNAALLARDAEKVYRVFEVNEAQSVDPAVWFSALGKDENSVVLAVANGNNTGLPASFRSALSSLGLKEVDALFHTPDLSYLAVACAGQAQEETSADLLEKVVALGDTSFALRSDGAKTGGAQLAQNGQKAFENCDGFQFAIYDKVLERATFYFRYDAASDTLEIHDFGDN